MSLSVTEKEHNTVVIQITGDFIFSLQKEFRNAYENLNSKKTIIIDLRETTYMDSSALGMILILNDKVSRSGSTIKVINCKEAIKRIFLMTNLDKIIEIN